MTRVSIKAHHKQFLENISAQMGCDQEPDEVIQKFMGLIEEF